MGALGRFQLESAVQSAHAARRLNGGTDWAAIVQLYDDQFALTDSVVVAVQSRGGARIVIDPDRAVLRKAGGA